MGIFYGISIFIHVNKERTECDSSSSYTRVKSESTPVSPPTGQYNLRGIQDGKDRMPARATWPLWLHPLLVRSPQCAIFSRYTMSPLWTLTIFTKYNQIKTCLRNSSRNKSGLMIYITITDHKRFLLYWNFYRVSDWTFKIKPFRDRKVMSKGYHRFCLTDLSEFLNLKVSNLWRGQREER